MSPYVSPLFLDASVPCVDTCAVDNNDSSDSCCCDVDGCSSDVDCCCCEVDGCSSDVDRCCCDVDSFNTSSLDCIDGFSDVSNDCLKVSTSSSVISNSRSEVKGEIDGAVTEL